MYMVAGFRPIEWLQDKWLCAYQVTASHLLSKPNRVLFPWPRTKRGMRGIEPGGARRIYFDIFEVKSARQV